MSGSESDAYQAYSKIQSLLEMSTPQQGEGHRGELLDTPAGNYAFQFQSPPSRIAVERSLVVVPSTAQSSGNNVSTYETYREEAVIRTSVDLLSLKVNEETFESKLHPDEQVFHSLLQHTMQLHQHGEFPSVTGVPAQDNIAQAEIIGHYACAAQDRFTELSQEARRHGAGVFFTSQAHSELLSGAQRKGSALQRELAEQRAERDLWSLLELLTASNLLYDINEHGCDEKLQKVLSGLPVTASIPDYLQAAFEVDDRLRKGSVLKEWVEKAAIDLVSEAPAPRGEPWSETLNRVLRTRHPAARNPPSTSTQLQSLHPDAQLVADGSLLSLDGTDRGDQESLLKTIWQLLRCGLVARAQQLASEHKLFWLAASLQGIATHAYKLVSLSEMDEPSENFPAGEEGTSVARSGNLKQPVWLRTCWLYANKISAGSSSGNHQMSAGGAAPSFGRAPRGSQADSVVGVLEMSIYAALCNNTRVLLSSPLVSSWQDKVWVYLKATHERDVARIVHQYRCAKSGHSKYYPGCDLATISAERELMDLSKGDIGHFNTADCVQIFNKIPPPSTVKNAEYYILNLQAAVMEGRSGILNFVENTMMECLYVTESFPGREAVLRVFAHFCIWLKYAHQDEAGLSELVSHEVLYLAVEKYIDMLIEKKQRSLVAVYAAYLNRPRRIYKYAQLLRSMQSSGQAGQNAADAAEVLQLANAFFPADVMDITRTVVESTQTTTESASYSIQASAQKRGVSAPPLHSLSSPSGVSSSLRPAGHHSVRFAVSEDAEQHSGSAEHENAFDNTVTPAKRSVRARAATPRPLKGIAGLGSKSGTPAYTGGAETPDTFSRTPTGASLPGTPGVGSSLIAYTPSDGSQQTLHTVLRAADASVPVTAEDAQQMESLRWLYFDASHRIEAVKQTNRFIVAYLLHGAGMKLAQVRTLLADYVPLDSVPMGHSLIEQRRNAVQGVEHQYLERYEVNNVQLLPVHQQNHISALKDELLVEQNVWEAQVCKLQLWQNFTSSLQDVDMYHRTVSEYQSESNRLLVMPGNTSSLPSALGRYRSKIIRTATTAADSLLRAVTCSGGTDEADGYKDIWDRNETSCVGYVTHTAATLRHALFELIENDDRTIGVEGWAAINLALKAVYDTATDLFPSQQAGDEGDVQAVHPVITSLEDLIHLELPQGESSPMDGEEEPTTAVLSDSALSVVTALNQCKQHLVDVKEGKQLAGALLFQLLTTYVQVCMSAGSILQALAQPSDAAAWYVKCMKLADLVATEDHSLLLYTLLHREDLEALLSGINTAAISLLAIDPDMNFD